MEIMASSMEIQNIETVIMKCSNAVPVSENEFCHLEVPLLKSKMTSLAAAL